MPNVPELLAPLVGEQPSALFTALLLVHIAAGLTSVICGAGAALSRKGAWRHRRFGSIYYWALAVVFATGSAMAALRWTEDAYLFFLGFIAFGAATIAYLARTVRWSGWIRFHIVGMGLSYVVMLTAFYVDNGPRLPLYDRLPVLAFWVVPSLIGLPLIARAFRRYGSQAWARRFSS